MDLKEFKRACHELAKNKASEGQQIACPSCTFKILDIIGVIIHTHDGGFSQEFRCTICYTKFETRMNVGDKLSLVLNYAGGTFKEVSYVLTIQDNIVQWKWEPSQ